jgi:hypothetical protein
MTIYSTKSLLLNSFTCADFNVLKKHIWEPLPLGKPSSLCNRLADQDVNKKNTAPKNLNPSVWILEQWLPQHIRSASDKTTFHFPYLRRTLSRCHLERGPPDQDWDTTVSCKQRAITVQGSLRHLATVYERLVESETLWLGASWEV